MVGISTSFQESLSVDAEDNLVDQISYIKTSADIDKSVEQLAAQNLKIYGGTYVYWDKERRELCRWRGFKGFLPPS